MIVSNDENVFKGDGVEDPTLFSEVVRELIYTQGVPLNIFTREACLPTQQGCPVTSDAEKFAVPGLYLDPSPSRGSQEQSNCL